MSYYRQPPHRGAESGLMIGVPPVTPVNRILMIACGAVWGVQFLLGPLLGLADLSWIFGLVPQAVIHGFVWQPVTYLFLHSPLGISHLLMNLLMMWMIGGDLERQWGAKRYLTYYLVCGVGAGFFVLGTGLARGTELPTIGASGAIYGLILAYGLSFSERRILFMLVFPMRARTLSWLLFGIALVSNWTAGTDGVSHVAHLGGMVVGWLYLKRAWRVGELYRDLRWKIQRRRFRVMPPRDEDRWIH